MEITIASAEKRLRVFDKGFDDMEEAAEVIIIDSEESQVIANEMTSRAKKLGKDIEGIRVAVYDEIYPKEGRKTVKATNDLAKGYKDRIASIVSILDNKYLSYRRKVGEEAARLVAEAARVQREAEEAAEKAREEAAAAFIPPASIPEAPKPAPVYDIQQVASVTVSDSGASYVKKHKSYVVVDFSSVPDSYKMLDEQKVRQMMHSKEREDIPGIKWTIDEKVATRLSK